jgi:hypothetical protein
VVIVRLLFVVLAVKSEPAQEVEVLAPVEFQPTIVVCPHPTEAKARRKTKLRRRGASVERRKERLEVGVGFMVG